MKRITNPKIYYTTDRYKCWQMQENMYEIMTKLAEKDKNKFIILLDKNKKLVINSDCAIRSCKNSKKKNDISIYLNCIATDLNTCVAWKSEYSLNVATYKKTWDLVVNE